MNRKKFIRNIGLGAGALAFSPILSACSKEKFVGIRDFLIPLPVAVEINAFAFSLSAAKSTSDISKDIRLEGFQINESFPSPTIRKAKGDTVEISFKNGIGQESIIHWHGFIIPPDMDGHPGDAVSSGQNYEYKYKLNQRAGTYWYHPHPDKLTGEQVYKGMAGFYIIEDEEEKALNLPSGKFEIPLLIQDRKVNSSGEIVFNPSMPEKMMTGILGEQILINGAPTPYHEVESSVYRLRLLNGSNARIYNIAFSE
jgi:FtsP/CotA-like multicopper oxidase with cupredoxin domain